MLIAGLTRPSAPARGLVDVGSRVDVVWRGASTLRSSQRSPTKHEIVFGCRSAPCLNILRCQSSIEMQVRMYWAPGMPHWYQSNRVYHLLCRGVYLHRPVGRCAAMRSLPVTVPVPHSCICRDFHQQRPCLCRGHQPHDLPATPWRRRVLCASRRPTRQPQQHHHIGHRVQRCASSSSDKQLQHGRQRWMVAGAGI